MALNDRQFENFVNNLREQKAALGEEEYFNVINSSMNEARSRKEVSTRTNVDRAKDFAGGVVYGLGAPGRTAQRGISYGLEALSGGRLEVNEDKAAFNPENFAKFGENQLVDTDTTSAKVGNFVGEAVPFAVGGGMTSAATKGASLLPRMLAQGGTSAVVQALNSGDIGKDEFVAFIAGMGSEVAGTLVNKTLQSASDQLPDWLVRPLVKQSAVAKQQGKDIVPYLVDSGYVGSVDELITKSQNSGSVLNGQISTILDTSDKTVNIRAVAEQVAEEFNARGAATNADEILDVVTKQAFESKGVLTSSADDIAIKTANSLRSQLDETLYSGRDYLRNVLPANKTILEAFTNKLRGTVQGLEPATQPLFSQYSKEITLRNALNAAQSASQGRNAVGLLDLVTGAGAFTYTGDPVSTLLAVGGRRAFEAPTVKTTLAQIFKNTDKVANFLSSASPAIRGAVLSLVSSLTNTKSTQDQEQASPRTQDNTQ